jgi:hypothetical protein
MSSYYIYECNFNICSLSTIIVFLNGLKWSLQVKYDLYWICCLLEMDILNYLNAFIWTCVMLQIEANIFF